MGTDIDAKENGANLRQAVANGDKETVKVLLDNGADVEAKGKSGWTPMTHAVVGGHKEIVRMLLDGGAAIDARTEQGSTALGIAVSWKHENVAKLLLDRGADVNPKQLWNKTILMQAVEQEWTEIVSLLLENGANLNAELDDSFIQFLKDEGKYDEWVAFVKSKGFHNEDDIKHGWTALRYAEMTGNKEIIKLLKAEGAKRQKAAQE